VQLFERGLVYISDGNLALILLHTSLTKTNIYTVGVAMFPPHNISKIINIAKT